MTQPDPSPAKRSNLPVYLLMAVAVVGVVASALLVRHHVWGGEVVGCAKSATFDCNAVNTSRYSEFRGIPLALLGFVTYVVVFGLAFTRSLKGPARGAGSMAYAFLVGLFASAFSVYLFYVSKFVLGKLCLWCAVTYLVNFATFGLAAWALGGPSQVLPAVKKDWDDLGSKRTLAYPLIAVIVVAFGFVVFAPGRIFNGPGEVRVLPAGGQRGDDPRAAILAAPYRDPGPGEGFAKGASNPVLTIVEFADLECPACRRAFWPLHEFVKKHPDEVRLVFRHYPLDRKCNASMRRVLHEYACDAAMAAEAAGMQGKFWEYVESVYRLEDEQGVTIVSPDLKKPALLERARALGLDLTAFEEALTSERSLDKILADLQDGNAFGVDSTPTLYVNGRKARGLPTPKALETWLKMAKAGELEVPKSSSMASP